MTARRGAVCAERPLCERSDAPLVGGVDFRGGMGNVALASAAQKESRPMNVRLGLVFALALGTTSAAVRADTYLFRLHNGGRVRGEWLNRQESPRETYVIQSVLGGKITLAKDQVDRVALETARQVEYQQIKGNYPDTVAGQWELAEWCRESFLLEERKSHLARIVQLEPDHKKARAALGFTQHQGRWLTQEQRMVQLGYRRYKGRWMLTQEIELAEKRRKQNLAELAWFPKLKMWRKWLFNPQRRELAKENLFAIRDPAAVRALRQYVDPEHERYPKVREYYIRALARIGNFAAQKAMVQSSLFDPEPDVRYTAMEALAEKKNPAVVDAYVAQLRGPSNLTINRAAVGLAHMKDESSIGPLIDALISIHTKKVTSGGAISTTFTNGGLGGFSAGSSTKIYRKRVHNESVRKALITITEGIDFSYNVPQWKTWYAARKATAAVNTRRD